ncbi:MAG: M20/M25/M40 family metallo-hydrolase, partial [Myxococcales bacterium]|nr:M20/M25/M40 family metallo-hydrolase [Myxococcales bacterium]
CEAAAACLDQMAQSLGLRVARYPDPAARYADHRVYATPAATGRALALVGHVDTVFPRALGFLDFRREGDRAHGPGVLDMKSGLSAIFFALQALRTVAPQHFARLALRVVVVTDEEVGSPSSRALFTALAPRIDRALVFESGREGDRVVLRRKGSGEFRLRVTGRAAHSGLRHAEGVNAIHALALLIPRVETLTDYARGVTVNVGLIEGGTARNTVPEQASCLIDARFERIADAETLQSALQALADAPLPERLAAARVTLEGRVARQRMEATDAARTLLAAYTAHAAAAGLGVGEAPLQGGGSDASVLSALGVPCLDGLGPFGEHFHRTDEWCSLDSLRRRTQALATFLAEQPTSGGRSRPDPGSKDR